MGRFLQGLFNTSVLPYSRVGVTVALLSYVVGKIFRGGPNLELACSFCNFLPLLMLGTGDTGLLRSIVSCGCPRRKCSLSFLWESFGRVPEFADFVGCDESSWPGCLIWHGWLLALSASQGQAHGLRRAGDVAAYQLERTPCSMGFPAWIETDPVVPTVSHHPNVWSDGQQCHA